MKKWILVFFIFSPFFNGLFGQTIDAKKLDDEISSLNDRHLYEKSILRLQYVLNDSRASHYDRYNAYLQKYFTYKRVSDFTTALEFLKAAENEGKQSDRKEEVETRIAVEDILIKVEVQEFAQVKKILADKQHRINLKLLDADTQGFYLSTLGIIDIFDKNFSQAEVHLNDAINIFQNNNPKHLANVYRKKIDLYKELGNEAKILESYEKGLYYANKYKVKVYEKGLYESMAQYYREKSDQEMARFYVDLSEKTSIATYKTLNESEKLKNLEQRLKDNQLYVKEGYEERFKVIFSIIFLLLGVLTFYYYKQSRINKRKRIEFERENLKIRKELNAILQKNQIEGSDLEIRKRELTERQLQIFELARQGKTNKEIGNELCISENTVKYHLKSIYTILDLENRFQLQG